MLASELKVGDYVLARCVKGHLVGPARVIAHVDYSGDKYVSVLPLFEKEAHDIRPEQEIELCQSS